MHGKSYTGYFTMGYEVLIGGRKKKSFRRPREIIELTILGPNIDFIKNGPISLKLVPQCSIPTLRIPTKFELSSCICMGVIVI